MKIGLAVLGIGVGARPEDAGRIPGWIETLAERWLAPAAKS